MADQKINGALYRSMVIEGALAIAEKKEQANELNVFPVPDGDTGTNMSMTMGSAMAEMENLAEPTLAKAADATASALLRGARGNSGVILSLLFRGMAKSCARPTRPTAAHSLAALREGVDTAYKAVMKPAEGTILTVSRVAAQHAVELCQAEPTLTAEQVLAAIIEQGHTALEETVHQNPVLEKAGVVDAGGFGFITIFEGHAGRAARHPQGTCCCGRADQVHRRLRCDQRRGHHLHLLHRVHRIPQGQGTQCCSSALHSERNRRFAGGCRG